MGSVGGQGGKECAPDKNMQQLQEACSPTLTPLAQTQHTDEPYFVLDKLARSLARSARRARLGALGASDRPSDARARQIVLATPGASDRARVAARSLCGAGLVKRASALAVCSLARLPRRVLERARGGAGRQTEAAAHAVVFPVSLRQFWRKHITSSGNHWQVGPVGCSGAGLAYSRPSPRHSIQMNHTLSR